MGVLIAALACFSAEAAETKDSWDGANYRSNSSQQKTSAQVLLKNYTLRADDKILDLGCGDGSIAAHLAAQVPEGAVVGVDLSSKMIEFASKNYRMPNLSFQVQDAAKLHLPPEFNLAFSVFALQWVGDQQAALQGIYKSLKSSAIFLAVMPAEFPAPMTSAIRKQLPP